MFKNVERHDASGVRHSDTDTTTTTQSDHASTAPAPTYRVITTRPPHPAYTSPLTCISSSIISSPFAAASRLVMCGDVAGTPAATTASPPPPSRMRTPLPSKTHGPASLRGVMGPSCPPISAAAAGVPPDAGDGVLAPSLRPAGIAAAAAAADGWVLPLAVRGAGMAMGLDVALLESRPLGDRPGRPFGVLFRLLGEMADGDASLSGVSEAPPSTVVSIMVVSMASGSCCAGTLAVAGIACGRAPRTLLPESRDFRRAAIVCGWAVGLNGGAALLALGFSEAPSCSLAASSESACSHSSGSSTSASRSAAARQFGHMKIGYEGEASRDRMHL